MTTEGPREPLFPNAWLVAKREYLDRVRGRPFIISTAVLVVVLLLVSLVPIGLRAVERESQSRIGVYAADATLAERAVGVIDSTVNQVSAERPPGATRAFDVRRAPDLEAALAQVRSGRLDGLLVVERRSEGGLRFSYHTTDTASSVRTQLVLFGALSTAILDWRFEQPSNLSLGEFHPPVIDTVTESAPSEGGRPFDPAAQASRTLLGTLFVVLIFITLITYGMWVASSVGTEKSSRVMELMIGAASPLQLLLGKVVGVGAAGLTQYVAIIAPAAIVVVLQGRIASFLLGTPEATDAPLAGLTLPLLLAYGVFFLLGFALYALLYAAAASLVSRQEDVQTLAMPLSLLSMAGYLGAVLGLSTIDSAWVAALSYVPFFSPFVMLARLMVGRVAPWEVAVSIALLCASVAVALWLAARVYRAGVLMYGQRPGFRVLLAAIREQE